MIAPLSTILQVGKFPQMVLLAVAVGIGGGIGAVLFHWMIDVSTWLFYSYQPGDSFVDVVESMSWYTRLLIPALGGLLVGIIIKLGNVTEAQGHGVPEVMESVALHRGTMRFRVAPIKTLASAITIGSGGSAGREGPIIQIGSAIGSNLGQYFRLDEQKTRTLLAAGAAAGIGGTFNAPIAGIVFAWEILLRRMSVATFILLLLAAQTGTYVAQTFLGFSGPMFGDISFVVSSHWELLLFVGLGLLAAWVAIFYDNILHLTELFFRSSRIPFLVRPALGGLLLGLIALLIPTIQEPASWPLLQTMLMDSGLPILLLGGLVMAKILATSVTIGSGGSGGIFAPALFIGAAFGSLYGAVLVALFPDLTIYAPAYALIGMAAVFGAAAHAPFSAIVIVFEMTLLPGTILPLIVACLVSSYAAKWLQKTNIYTAELQDKSINIDKVYTRLNARFKRWQTWW